jgi:hypothetical protein
MKTTAAIRPLIVAAFQVGGRSILGTGFRLAPERIWLFASALDFGRPLALVSISPAWVPRRFFRRFFLVCAIA